MSSRAKFVMPEIFSPYAESPVACLSRAQKFAAGEPFSASLPATSPARKPRLKKKQSESHAAFVPRREVLFATRRP